MPTTDLSEFYMPHPGQKKIHDSVAKFKYLEIARRWGKSRFAIGELMRVYLKALETPVPRSLIPPFHAWVVVPAYPQGHQTWLELTSIIPRRFIRDATLDGNRKEVRHDTWKVWLKGNKHRAYGLIEVKTAFDPDSLQSVGLDFLWVNEAQDIDERAFNKLLPTMRQPLRMARAVFEGIPAWPDHWFARGCDAAKAGRVKNTAYFKATAFENPMLTEEQLEEIESDRELMLDREWRRMYLAERQESGGFFTNIDNCIAGEIIYQPVPGVNYVAGLDIGLREDPTVLYILDANHRKVVYKQEWQSEAWAYITQNLLQLHETWNFQELVFDATSLGGKFAQESLEETPISLTPIDITGANRQTLLKSLALAIERGTVSYPRIDKLIRQLRAFRTRKTVGMTERWVVDVPSGEHDDEVWAFALALTACDAAIPVTPGGNMGTSRRWLPTQAEANGNMPNGFGSRYMKERAKGRMEERAEMAGVI